MTAVDNCGSTRGEEIDSRTVVGQNLSRLEEQGFLECGYGVIRLIDPAGLRAWLRDTA